MNNDILAPKMSTQIEDITPKIEELKKLAGDDFSQEPVGEKEQMKFVLTAQEVNSAVQKMVQQGFQFGTEVEKVDESGNSTGETVELPIQSIDELSALQARMNDVNEKLPKKKQWISLITKFRLKNIQVRSLTTIT
ncbi:hypothetical protein KIMC2_20580 [Xylocopilactobacillus apis]|uniref:Uncharacterized protein n=1 Tax=Xylocopilactobacillus apis TaxID=2932183 RepID=A0AAU9DGT7_9LACO|nr:hypothetical protein [Xylocopilactobacillus apis]BDR57496.1 hypothetical protein KIMC2_20580 [Xylocopilactobacillus apis]